MVTPTRTALALLAGAAAAALALWVAVRPRPGPPAEAPPPLPFALEMAEGRRSDLLVELSTEGSVDAGLAAPGAEPGAAPRATGRALPVRSSFTGRLALRFHRDGPGGWTVAALLDPREWALAGRRPAWAWQASEPFLFHVAPTGRVSGLELPAGADERARAFLLQVVSGLQVVLPARDVAAWTAEASDARGSLRIAYTRREEGAPPGAFAVDRRLASIAPGPGGEAGALPGASFRIEASEGLAVVSAARWTERVESSETVGLSAGGAPLATTTSRFAARAVEPGPDPLPPTLAAVRERLRSQAFVDRLFRATDPELDALGAPLGLDGALERYLALAAGDRRRAEAFLVNYLRLKPDMAARLLRLVDADRAGRRLDERTQLVLWRLVAEAGTPEAQRAVADVVLGPSWSRTSRVRALLQAVDFANPGSELPRALWELHREPSRDRESLGVEVARNMSLLAVGGVGSRDHLNEETRRSVAASLRDHLEASRGEPAELATTLQAIGNTGNDELLDAVRPWLSGGDEPVRAAACEALRRMPGAGPRTLLAATAETDASARVREEALRTLGRMPTDPATAAWARGRLAASTDAREQVLLVELLGPTLPGDTASELALRALLERDPAPIVKETLYRFLAPRP